MNTKDKSNTIMPESWRIANQSLQSAETASFGMATLASAMILAAPTIAALTELTKVKNSLFRFEHAVDDAPGKGAMATAALQGEIDKEGFDHGARLWVCCNAASMTRCA